MAATDAAGNPASQNLLSNWTVALSEGQEYARFLSAPLGLIGSADPQFITQVSIFGVLLQPAALS